MSAAADQDLRTDEQLAVLVQSSGAESARAYAVLYKRHAPALLAFLAARLRDRDEATDLCQQVWVKVWEQLATHFKADHFRGWVFQMARNLLIDHHRKRRPDTMPEEFDPADRRVDLSGDAVDQRVAHLKPCVEALAEDRKAIVQARLVGASFDDISQQMGIPPNTAMTRFHRAKDQLRDCIEKRAVSV
ncbi:MAG: sigma-70 family RNA polymerase sigma factor [Planctomycetaceae bacterium]|nr:sigma-70 family RNA polymerase sigma factor [Planctomycetaceae bacterium]